MSYKQYNSDAILRFIKRYTDANNLPPSRREIQEACDISSLSIVNAHLHKLQDGGYIEIKPHLSRAIRILK